MRRLLLLSALTLAAQTNWPHFGNDPGAMRWSPLRQINAANVSRLQPAWTFRMGKPGSEAIPVVINGILYANAPDGVYALVPETGELLWKYNASPVALRGLAYWPGASGLHPRLFTGNGHHLLALDTTTGKPAPGFGNEGRVDLKAGVLDGLPDARYQLQSPPAVFGDIVITGSSNGEGAPTIGAYGDIRGWDARTGKLLWTFHTVPRPGEPGYETWPPNGYKNRSGTNVWGFFTVDVQRGIVYAPLGSPTNDFYGADRKGDNLYGNSLVALDARTGKKLWHQQLVHHDIWDYDPAAPPALFDIKGTPVVAQITKVGLLFVFDRVTGKPYYGLEERPVPASIVPGEFTSPTQPFPVKPPPLSRLNFSEKEIYDRSPEHAKFCRDLFTQNNMKIGVPYTPLGLTGNDLFFPSTLGGGGWGGVSIDPTQRLLFVNVMHVGQWGHMEKRIVNGQEEYFRTSAYGPYARFWNRETRVPCSNPPFGEMLAIDLPSGDVRWRSPLGRIEALEALGVKDTGSVNLGGSIATAGHLVFIGAANDSRFRAYDSRNGKLVWEVKVEASAHTSPITYLGRDGRQYVAVMAAGGGGFLGGGSSNTLVAFALPDVPRKPLPAAVSRAVAAAAAQRRNEPKVGAFTPVTLPAGAAKALLEKSCGQGCHSIEVVTTQRHSAAEWKDLVQNMIARGAPVRENEIDTLINYLATTLAPR